MCGIAGIVPRQPVDGAVARAVLERLRRRGPDDQGWARLRHEGRPELGREWEAPQVDGPVLLHRRLSILDLSQAGWQPMTTADGRFTIVYNGEVYNHVELRAELEALGSSFASHCDTEVVLEAYRVWGAAALGRFVGMFAFVVHDRERRELFLARDPFGIKPLFWCLVPEGFAFASDLPSLLEVPWVPRVADPVTVHEFLTTDGGRTGAGERSFLRDVRQVPAGHHLTVPLDLPTVAPRPVRYWPAPPPRTPRDVSYEEAVAEVRRRFLHNVRLHLRSDVPVGAALSGGIDSSAIVGAMRHLAGSATDLHTFTYVADDPQLTEEAWADRVAQAAGVRAHKVRPSRADFIRDLPALVEAQGEPFGSTSIYAQYRVFEAAAAAGVRVMLDGQGADEMVGGYRYFYPVRLGWLLRRGRLVEAVRTFNGMRRQPGVSSLRLAAESAAAALPSRGRALLRASGLIDRRFRPDSLDVRWFRRRGVRPGRPARHVVREGLVVALHDAVVERSLPPLLRYEDRNSMAWSVESRVPFLTPDLVTYLLSLPAGYLIGRDGTTKRVLRDALRGLVPDDVLARRDKVGFVTTEQEWLAAVPDWVVGVLRRGGDRLPFLDVEKMMRHWVLVLEGRRPYRGLVWRTLCLILWVERFDVRFDAPATLSVT